VKLTPATMLLRDALARSLAICWHDGDEKLVDRRWENQTFRHHWQDRAADSLFNNPGHPVSVAVDKVRREAFESGGSPAISVLLTELEEAAPGEYQAGLARAVYLLSQEMAQHYGSVFEAGLRVGREQARKAGADGG
jgi:hypothetical protein